MVPRVSGLSGGLLFEECGDTLPSDAEQVCDGLDGESVGSQGEGFGSSELGAGGLQGGHVGRDQLDHTGGVFGFDQLDEALSCVKSLTKLAGSSLELAAAFDVVLGGSVDVGKGGEQPLDRRLVGGQGPESSSSGFKCQ